MTTQAILDEMATLLSYEKQAMKLAHELNQHTELNAEGYLSELKWRTLAAQHKAENLARRIKQLDERADALRESLGIRED